MNILIKGVMTIFVAGSIIMTAFTVNNEFMTVPNDSTPAPRVTPVNEAMNPVNIPPVKQNVSTQEHKSTEKIEKKHEQEEHHDENEKEDHE